MPATSTNYFSRIDSNNRYFDQQTPSPTLRDYAKAVQLFQASLTRGGQVLGVGSGDGRYLQIFKDAGHPVLGVEPSARRRAAAIAAGIPTIEGTFENLSTRGLAPAAGIWCGAALQHLPGQGVTRAIRALSELLISGGPLFITFELGDSAAWVPLRGGLATDEVFVQQHSEGAIDLACRQQRLAIVERWAPPPSAGRTAVWQAVVAVKL